MNIFKNIIDKVVDAFSSSKEFKTNDYDETNYDCKIVPYNEILESKNGILIALLSKIAKSDGVISENESNYISKQIDSFQIKEEIRHIYSKEIINQEKDNTSNIQELCRNLLGLDENESKIFIKNLVDITKVDNKFYENQYKILSDIMTFINLPEDSIKEFQIELLEKPNEECKKLYQKLYILKLEKEDIESKIEEIEYEAFKNYGEIKLELLSLKKDLSKEFLEEYNNYLKFYNKYKNYTKNFDESLTNYKAYIDFHRLNMLTQIMSNYKHDISLLQKEIKELKRNESYQMSLNFMTVNRYSNSERELLKTELELIQNEKQNKSKIIVVNEILESKNGILIALLSKIAKSDGVISENESNYISKQIDSFQIKEEIRHIYSKEIINQEKDNTSNIQELCRNLLGLDENESKIFIKNLVDITKVDNKFDKNQYKILSDIMTFINLPEDSIKEFQIELLEKPNEECKKLYQKLYTLKLEKEDIESKIEEIEYRAFKTYGKIKLELLSLKKDISKKCMDEYKNYLKIYDKYENYKNNKRPILEDEVFNNICKLNILEQKIDYCKSEISNLERNIEELKKNEFLKIGDKIQYLMLEKELLNEELESIQNKRQNKTKIIVVTEDIELKKLKQKLKKVEIKFQELIEEKTEYLNDIEEFNTQYSLHLGELIKTILNLKKEILYKKTIKTKKLKKQHKANKDICDETKQTIDELKNTVFELEEILENIDKDDENYEEISSAYNEIKKELEKLEDELLVQEKKLEKTEKELKENDIFEKEYENAKATYEQFDNEYEHIKDTQKDVIKLDEEQQKELKILFKKAAKLCHPDIVAGELKEKALEIMQSLNDAYSKKDIEQVKKILLSLESGTTFKTVSSDIEDKELLLNKIKEFEQNISDLKDEIKTLKDDDIFTTILQLDNWNEYFEELKNELTEQKANLEKEAVEVLEDENKDISKEKEIIIEKHKTKNLVIQKENSDYSRYIQSIENIKFEKIRKYCENLSKDNSTDDMQKYLAQNGKMYKALIYDALEQFISKLDNQTITLIDWGSNQGIASMVVLDYIKEKQLDIKVSQVILVDDDTKILSRAMAQVEALSQDNIQIISIKNDDDNLLDKIKTNRNTIALNLFANDKIPMDVKVINVGIYEDFIMCLSHENIEFVDKIYNDFNNSTNIQDLSIRDGNIGRYQRYERIFKLIN